MGTGHGCAPTHASTPPHFAEPPDVLLDCKQLDSLMKSGRLTDALDLFDRMPRKNVVAWTSAISSATGLGRHYEQQRARVLMALMQSLCVYDPENKNGLLLPHTTTDQGIYLLYAVNVCAAPSRLVVIAYSQLAVRNFYKLVQISFIHTCVCSFYISSGTFHFASLWAYDTVF
jgi:pentatricopeptide repeat protein